MNNMVLILNNDEVKNLLSMNDCIQALEDAYTEESNGRAINQLRYDTEFPLMRENKECSYQFKTMVGILPKIKTCALRMSSTFEFSETVNNSENNNGLERPRVIRRIPLSAGRGLVGLVQLFSLETGDLLAIYPDGYVQGMRVAATYALATKYLAKRNSSIIGLYGTGHQAQFAVMAQAEMLKDKIAKIKVYSPNSDHRREFVRRMSKEVPVNLEEVNEPRSVMKDSDIVLAMTNSVDPVVRSEWVEKGMFIASVKAEVDLEIFGKLDIIVLHSKLRYKTHVAGQGQYGTLVVGKNQSRSVQLAVDREKCPLLEDIISGKVQGRTTDEQTIYFDNGSGMGIQFAATGAVIYQHAIKQGVGREIPSEWFTQKLHT
jgi:alanine dehydrogenase